MDHLWIVDCEIPRQRVIGDHDHIAFVVEDPGGLPHGPSEPTERDFGAYGDLRPQPAGVLGCFPEEGPVCLPGFLIFSQHAVDFVADGQGCQLQIGDLGRGVLQQALEAGNHLRVVQGLTF